MSQIDWDNLKLANKKKREKIEQGETYNVTFDTKPMLPNFDLDNASKILPWEKIEEFKEKAKDYEVVTLSECENALSMAMQSRKLSKVVDEKRKEITRPALDFQKGMKKIADAFIEELKNIETSLQKKVLEFNENRKKKANELKVDLDLVNDVEDGTMYQQEIWNFELVDIEKVPRKYLKIDEKAIKAAIKEGEREIEGITIFKTTQNKFRTKK